MRALGEQRIYLLVLRSKMRALGEQRIYLLVLRSKMRALGEQRIYLLVLRSKMRALSEQRIYLLVFLYVYSCTMLPSHLSNHSTDKTRTAKVIIIKEIIPEKTGIFENPKSFFKNLTPHSQGMNGQI